MKQTGMVSGQISPLELLQPDGRVERARVIGTNCPARLRPETQCGDDTSADLVILAPTREECAAPGWLHDAVHEVDSRLSPSGIVYVMAPRPWRLKIERLLHGRGLRLEPRFIHLPDWESSCYLVPIAPAPIRYAFSNLMPARRSRLLLAQGALLFPGGAGLLSTLLPWTGFVAARPGSRAPFAWISDLDGETRHPQNAILTNSWRHRKESIVLHRFAGADADPSIVVKLGRTVESPSSPRGEVYNIERMGPGAEKAGAEIPQPWLVDTVGGHRVLFENFIGGRSAAALLAARPDRVDEVMERLTEWLVRWNRETCIVRPAIRELLDEVLSAAAGVCPRLDYGDEYYDWLRAKCASIHDPVPLMAVHNDLTMWNVLLDEHGRLGIVDWEAAREEYFPLVDFYYAMVAAVASAHHWERIEAYRTCFTPGGAYARVAAGLLNRLKQSLEIPDDFAELCRHACFLHHAANEQRAAGPGEPQPFLEILQWVARNAIYCPEL